MQHSGGNHLKAEDPEKEETKTTLLPFIDPGGQEQGEGDVVGVKKC